MAHLFGVLAQITSEENNKKTASGYSNEIFEHIGKRKIFNHFFAIDIFIHSTKVFDHHINTVLKMIFKERKKLKIFFLHKILWQQNFVDSVGFG